MGVESGAAMVKPQTTWLHIVTTEDNSLIK